MTLRAGGDDGLRGAIPRASRPHALPAMYRTGHAPHEQHFLPRKRQTRVIDAERRVRGERIAAGKAGCPLQIARFG